MKDPIIGLMALSGLFLLFWHFPFFEALVFFLGGLIGMVAMGLIDLD